MSTLRAADLIEASELLSRVAAPGSGRAAWDERGNSIWEWQTEPGVFSREVTEQQLQTLQAPNLRLVDATGRYRVPENVGRWLRAR